MGLRSRIGKLRQRLAWLVSGDAPDATSALPEPGSTNVASARLVGAGSADLSTPEADVINRVDVALQEIRSDSMPGLDPVAGDHLLGRFGWWVGEEGVKARENKVSSSIGGIKNRSPQTRGRRPCEPNLRCI